MGSTMRSLIAIGCEGARLGATLDRADGATGLLIVTGGTQTRIGSHRMFERLAAALSEAGHPVFRFDRRGVGDSEGDDPGFRGNGPDIAAASAAFREQCANLERIVGFGLCDGATSLALSGAAGFAGLILANPWFVETEAGEPAAAAIKAHYRQRLASFDGWRRLLTGGLSYRKLVGGLAKLAQPQAGDLAAEAAAGLAGSAVPIGLVLSRNDSTAIAGADAWGGAAFASARKRSPKPIYIESDSHTFARPGDMDALITACLDLLRRFER